jgi:hydrogenase maturation protease
LVIGYGNEMRGDDGLGPELAHAIEQLHLPGVQIITCHQLTPELAEPISRADAVVFLDAAVDAPAEVQIRPLTAAASFHLSAHTGDPAALLGIAQQLFGHSPRAWWITAPAFDLGYKFGLSERAQSGLRSALCAFEKLWTTLTARAP